MISQEGACLFSTPTRERKAAQAKKEPLNMQHLIEQSSVATTVTVEMTAVRLCSRFARTDSRRCLHPPMTGPAEPFGADGEQAVVSCHGQANPAHSVSLARVFAVARPVGRILYSKYSAWLCLSKISARHPLSSHRLDDCT